MSEIEQIKRNINALADRNVSITIDGVKLTLGDLVEQLIRAIIAEELGNYPSGNNP